MVQVLLEHFLRHWYFLIESIWVWVSPLSAAEHTWSSPPVRENLCDQAQHVTSAWPPPCLQHYKGLYPHPPICSKACHLWTSVWTSKLRCVLLHIMNLSPGNYKQEQDIQPCSHTNKAKITFYRNVNWLFYHSLKVYSAFIHRCMQAFCVPPTVLVIPQ